MKFREMEPWRQKRKYINQEFEAYVQVGCEQNEAFKKAEMDAREYLNKRGLDLPFYEIKPDLGFQFLRGVVSTNVSETLRKMLEQDEDEKKTRELKEALTIVDKIKETQPEGVNPHEEEGITQSEYGVGVHFKGLGPVRGLDEVKKMFLERKELIISEITDAETLKWANETFLKLTFDPAHNPEEMLQLWREIKEEYEYKVNGVKKYIIQELNIAYGMLANALVEGGFIETITKYLMEDEVTEYKIVDSYIRKINTQQK